MRVRVSYPIDVNDYFRRAIRSYYGQPGLASREEVVAWFRLHGSSMDDDVTYELDQKIKRGEEPDV